MIKSCKTKRERLLAVGWREGSVQQFLELSDEEMERVETRRLLLKLIDSCKQER
jgi:hypothetical protein